MKKHLLGLVACLFVVTSSSVSYGMDSQRLAFFKRINNAMNASSKNCDSGPQSSTPPLSPKRKEVFKESSERDVRCRRKVRTRKTVRVQGPREVPMVQRPRPMPKKKKYVVQRQANFFDQDVTDLDDSGNLDNLDIFGDLDDLDENFSHGSEADFDKTITVDDDALLGVDDFGLNVDDNDPMDISSEDERMEELVLRGHVGQCAYNAFVERSYNRAMQAEFERRYREQCRSLQSGNRSYMVNPMAFAMLENGNIHMRPENNRVGGVPSYLLDLDVTN